MRPSGSDQQGDPQMYIATTHRHTHANHRCYNDLHASSTARRHRLVWPRIAPSDLLKETLHVVLLPRPSLGQISPRIPTARFSKVFATVLQTPKSFLRHLQHCCKHQKVFRGTCNTVANTRKFFVALATPLQTPKSFSRHLQHRCKRQKVFRGTCNTVANTKKNLGAFATLLQTFSFQRTKLFTKSLAPDPLLTPF